MTSIQAFFEKPTYPLQRQYEALRAYLYENLSAKEVAKRYDYSENSLYCFASKFKKQLIAGNVEERFFAPLSVGRPPKQHHNNIDQLIIELRKKYLSVPDIKAIIDTQHSHVSETYISNLLKKEGFGRLPRRSKQIKLEPQKSSVFVAPSSKLLSEDDDVFNSANIGLLCLLPYLIESGLEKIIKDSSFPGTKTIPKMNAILSFVALKLSNIKRYTSDDLWCMDRGYGLFAGLNVLPKAAWFSSYSHSVTRDMNINFLRGMNQLWQKNGLLSDTINLDFVSIPYWGDDAHLENNWSGTRHKALPSILAAIAQEPDTGIMTYGDTTVKHDNESDVVVEFLDFYKKSGAKDLKCLVFDSKFTTYENLRKLDNDGIKFITIRRRGKKIVDELESLPASEWRKVRVQTVGNNTRQLKVRDHIIELGKYGKKIRQVAITGNGKIKPALLISNDFDIKLENLIKKYARRWLVEKNISEQTHFFHLNRLSSSMVIKVDFDLTMTILTHNLYRLFAVSLSGYENFTASTLYEKFICNNGNVIIKNDEVCVFMKKKRNLPELLTAMNKFKKIKIPWIKNKSLIIAAANNS